ncbi:MAG: hypothetical protein ABI907_08965 [Ramlibacter sp.]
MALIPKKPSSLDRPFVAGDSIPAPLAVEEAGDTAWAMFQDLSATHEARFAATEPAPLPMRAPPPPSAAAVPQRKQITVEEVILESRKNNRVCPMPARWQQLYDMLPGKQRHQPPPPVIGAAWNVTPSMSKRMCLRDHIEWADKQGMLGHLHAFLKLLPEDQWHHMGD